MSPGDSLTSDTRGPDDPSLTPPDELVRELAGIFAAGYLRLLLRAAPDPPTSQQLATCGPEESAIKSDKELEAMGPQINPL